MRLHRETYLNQVQQLKKNLEQRFSSRAHDVELSYEYQLCKANIKRFMPTHKANHVNFYQELLFYREWAVWDFKQKDTFYFTKFTGNTSFIEAASEPYIFCTFHMGAYRQISHFLWRNNINFTSVVDAAALANQSEEIYNFHKLHDEFNKTAFKMLNAESPTIGLQMIREIKAGNSLLFYIDGNSGVGGMGRNDEKLSLINFCGQQIYARKGIAFISHVTGAPIIPLVSYRNSLEAYTTHFFEPISAASNVDRETFSHQATQQIYDLFYPFLAQYPEQWEGWLYINSFLAIPEVPVEHNSTGMPINLLSFNEMRYGIYLQEDKYYLLDTKTYLSYPISEPLYKVLEEIKAKSFAWTKDLANKPIFQDLISKQILVQDAVPA